MEQFSDFVHEAGWGIYPVLVFGSASLVAAIGYARTARRDVFSVLFALGVLTCLFGLLGTATGLQASARAINTVSLDDKWIFIVGLRESLNNLVGALLIVCLDGMVVSASLTRRLFTNKLAALHGT